MKQTFQCIKMQFRAPLHLARGRATYDSSEQTLHSDALGAALFVAALQLGAPADECREMLDAVRFSSAFPYCDEQYFFPKPLTPLPFKPAQVTEMAAMGKAFKKIRYLEQSWFEKVLHAEQDQFEQSQEFLGLKAGSGPVFVRSVTQRVLVPLNSEENPTPFYTERLYFGPKAGLFVLARWDNEEAGRFFKRAFRLLGDMGIGTDRNVGNGFFDPQFVEHFELRQPETASHQCALGLYLPKKEELNETLLADSAWNLLRRGGYMAGAANPEHLSLRKRSVYMFDVGSVFPSSTTLQGRIIDLQPRYEGLSHPVWRSGKPIFVPLQAYQGDES